jgi:hypothetical protein
MKNIGMGDAVIRAELREKNNANCICRCGKIGVLHFKERIRV